MRNARLLLAAFAITQNSDAQNFIDILSGSNNVPITSVSYLIDGNTVNQTFEASGVTVNRDAPVTIQSVTVNDGGVTRILDSFNTIGATVANVNLATNTNGVFVFDNGVKTGTSKLNSFSTALAGMTQDSDLLHYLVYDNTSNLPNSTTSDFDLMFAVGFESNDLILVSERNGNTFFAITPLDSEGNVIAGANILRFGGGTTLGPHKAYDWRTGYASSTYEEVQDFAFSVAEAGKFFEGTGVTPQSVFGFRIDNNGDADVKFFGLSDTPFTGRNIPEPSIAILSMVGSFMTLLRRR